MRAVASVLGEVLDIETDELGLETYRKIKLMLDVSKPLRRVQRVRGKDGRKIHISFQFERLFFFCFLCSIMGLGEKDCAKAAVED